MIKFPNPQVQPYLWLDKAPPPLNSGDRLPLAEFKRRFAAQPDIKKAELIEGVVHVASPVYLHHSEPHLHIATWLGLYCSATKGVRVADNQSVQLDADNEVQPDVCAWLEQEARFTITEKGLLIGAPDLVVEVGASSASHDLHDKLHVYRRNQVLEYLVLTTYEKQIYWFYWDEGAYVALEPDEQGVYRSRLFPGLWLDGRPFWEGNLAQVLATLQSGLQSEAHQAFVASL